MMKFSCTRKENGPMNEITTLAIDLAKQVFQLHGVDARGVCVLRRQVRRAQLLPLIAQLPACMVMIQSARVTKTRISSTAAADITGTSQSVACRIDPGTRHMSIIIDILEAKTHLCRIVDGVAAG